MSEVTQRVAKLIKRQESPDHVEFQRLLDHYLRVLKLNGRVPGTTDPCEEIVEAREALYEWARPTAGMILS